jgi:hypothetical protein
MDVKYLYTACLFFDGKLLKQDQHKDLDKLTAKVLVWLEEVSQGASATIYDDSDKIVGTYQRSTIA